MGLTRTAWLPCTRFITCTLPLRFTVIRLLVENRGQVLTRERLLEQVWDGGEFVDENALSVAVNRLRRKLGEAPIRTVYGVGYVWAEG